MAESEAGRRLKSGLLLGRLARDPDASRAASLAFVEAFADAPDFIEHDALENRLRVLWSEDPALGEGMLGACLDAPAGSLGEALANAAFEALPAQVVLGRTADVGARARLAARSPGLARLPGPWDLPERARGELLDAGLDGGLDQADIVVGLLAGGHGRGAGRLLDRAEPSTVGRLLAGVPDAAPLPADLVPSLAELLARDRLRLRDGLNAVVHRLGIDALERLAAAILASKAEDAFRWSTWLAMRHREGGLETARAQHLACLTFRTGCDRRLARTHRRRPR